MNSCTFIWQLQKWIDTANSESVRSIEMNSDNVVKFKTREERDLEEILNAVKIMEENGRFEIQDEEEEENNWRPYGLSGQF